jgi:ATP-dependent Clp protease ATP-binding subunit ClpA
MTTHQSDSSASTDKTLRVFVVVKKIGPKAFQARPLPPFDVKMLGSSVSVLVEQIKCNLEKKIHKTSASVLSRPIPGNDPRLAPPEVMTVKVPLIVEELRIKHHLVIDLDVVYWQIDEKNWNYFIPALDRALVGRPAHWQGDAMIRELAKEIRNSMKKDGLDHIKDFLIDKNVSLREIHLDTKLITDKRKYLSRRKQLLLTLRKTSTDVRKWQGEPVFQRDDITDRVASLLTSGSAQCVLLVGEPGVGKTAVVQQLPQRNTQLPPLWSTSGPQLVAGMVCHGMWQEQLLNLLGDIREIKAILHVGSLVDLVEAGKLENRPGIASMLKPEMQRGRVRIISECTPAQYQMLETQDPGLLRCFVRIDVDELPDGENLLLLQQSAKQLLANRQTELTVAGFQKPISIDTGVVESIFALCKRFCSYQPMPGIPLRLLKSVIGSLSSGDQLTVSRITQAFSSHTGLPLFLIDDDVPLDYRSLQERLSRRVVGQSEPVDLITNLITTLKARLQSPEKPLASFLFVGPTGVGKTEMAKSLAEVLFGDSNRLVRIDMSEYTTPTSIGRLTGTLSADTGTLTGPILDQPFSLVLLDEIEKAHPSVFDLLLQVLGDGRLTDTAGRRADFRSCVIIMTSNLGVESFRGIGSGFNSADPANFNKHFQDEVRRYVRPELLGRLDRVVPFRPLTRQDVCLIAERELEKVWMRPGLMYGKWHVHVSKQVIEWVAEQGYQPQYGARPLRRAIEDYLVVPISRFILENRSKDDLATNQRKLTVEMHEGRIRLSEDAKEVQVLGGTTAELRRLTASYLDKWRVLRHMANLAIHSSFVRNIEGDLDRTEMELHRLRKRIKKKSIEGTSNSHSLAALFHNQGNLESHRQSILNRLSRLQENASKINLRYRYALKTFLNGEHLGRFDDLYSLETELQNSFLDLVVQENTTKTWSLFYWGAPIDEFRFLIEAHRKTFGGSNDIWVLYEPKKFQKLYRDNRLPKPFVLSELKIWSEDREKDKAHEILQWSDQTHLVACKNTQLFEEGWPIDAVGLAYDASPGPTQRLWIEQETGTHLQRTHQDNTGSKLKMKVQVFSSELEKVILSSGFLEKEFASEINPLRRYSKVDQLIVDIPSDISIPVASGNLCAAVERLLERIHEQLLLNLMDFKPLPESSNAVSKLF